MCLEYIHGGIRLHLCGFSSNWQLGYLNGCKRSQGQYLNGKERMENALHFVCTNKCCWLQAVITDKTFVKFFLYLHEYHYHKFP